MTVTVFILTCIVKTFVIVTLLPGANSLTRSGNHCTRFTTLVSHDDETVLRSAPLFMHAAAGRDRGS